MHENGFQHGVIGPSPICLQLTRPCVTTLQTSKWCIALLQKHCLSFLQKQLCCAMAKRKVTAGVVPCYLLPAGVVRKSAASLTRFLDTFSSSKHYARMQQLRNQALSKTAPQPNLALSFRTGPTLPDSNRGSVMPQAANADHSADSPLIAAQNPLLVQGTDAQTSLSDGLTSPDQFPAAYAADWTCLLWLLQTAPEEVLEALKGTWREHQALEFALWVRPSAELNPVRSKAAAKVCPATASPPARDAEPRRASLGTYGCYPLVCGHLCFKHPWRQDKGPFCILHQSHGLQLHQTCFAASDQLGVNKMLLQRCLLCSWLMTFLCQLGQHSR